MQKGRPDNRPFWDQLDAADSQATVTRTSLELSKVETIEIHHLLPCRHKLTYERLLRVVTRIDFRNGSELGVRTEAEVAGSRGPLELPVS